MKDETEMITGFQGWIRVAHVDSGVNNICKGTVM